MKNIFNYDTIPSQSSMTVNNLTVGNSLTLSGAQPNELLITDTGGLVTEFTNGPANYILEIGPTSLSPKWTNLIQPDHVQVNTIGINGTSAGDIFQVDPSGSGNFARVPIGTTGQLLKVGSGNTIGWGPLVVPDPMTINDLIVQTSIKLGAGMGLGKLFVDGNNNVYGERDQYLNNYNIISYSTSQTVLFTNVTSPFNTIAGHNYLLSVNFENGNNYGTNYSTIQVIWKGVIIKQCVSLGPNDILHFEYIYQETTTGSYTLEVVGQTNTGSSSATSCAMKLSPLSV